MGKHDDIIHLDRPADPLHRPMSLHNRAAQFAPFDALTGFSGRIYEASRVTEPQFTPAEDADLLLNRKLSQLAEHVDTHPRVQVTYFVPDQTKGGGSHQKISAMVIKLDAQEEQMILEGGLCIPFFHILSLDCNLFDDELNTI